MVRGKSGSMQGHTHPPCQHTNTDTLTRMIENTLHGPFDFQIHTGVHFHFLLPILLLLPLSFSFCFGHPCFRLLTCEVDLSCE